MAFRDLPPNPVSGPATYFQPPLFDEPSLDRDSAFASCPFSSALLQSGFRLVLCRLRQRLPTRWGYRKDAIEVVGREDLYLVVHDALGTVPDPKLAVWAGD